ncbi:FadR/GntR family transcriptional regulator [Phytoactinopolyspora halophila]|uniref:FadR/GntR family transcriptional regulator n=1 Tax=Phytoactinopolyspora halophila TaxID=1981511 RepID=UPI001314BF24|nr:FadR/GntR family transcriptional regulator [Phytoactinopolyspora halophila]
MPPLNAHERVVDHLEHLVFGELAPGSPLPSESQLVEQLGVSRLTVREAVRSLQARGLIEVHRGRRPVVARLNTSAITDFFASSIRRDPRSVLDLLEVRRGLEVQTATLAAGRMNRTAATSMTESLDAMHASLDDPDAFDSADVRFHEALASASGNQVLTFLIEAMALPLRESRRQSRHGHLARGRPLVAIIEEHRRILECVLDGDAKGAAEAMQAHLRQTERSLHMTLDLPLAGNGSEPGPAATPRPSSAPADEQN